MGKIRIATLALGVAAAVGLAAGPGQTQSQLGEAASTLVADFARTASPLLPTVLDWSNPDHRAMIEGLFAAATMREDERAALQQMFDSADTPHGAAVRARTLSISNLADGQDDYWIGPVTSVFDIEQAGNMLAVNSVVSIAAPPARCFGLLALSPDDNFAQVQASAVQRQFSCADLQMRVRADADSFAMADGTPAAIAVSAAQYPDGEVHFLASSSTSSVSSGAFTATSVWPPQDAPGALIKVCVYRLENDCSYTFNHGQELNFKIEGAATLNETDETFVPDYPVQMNALVQRTEGGGCYMFDETRDGSTGLTVTYGDNNRQIGWNVDNIHMYNPDNCLTGQNAVHYYFSLQVRTAGTPLSGVQHIYVATPHYLSTAPDLLLPPMEVAWGCLAQGSLVTMADGSLRAIEDITAGEQVRSGRHLVTVTELTTGVEPNPMVIVVTQDGSRLSMTRDHPVPVGDRILRADALMPGMILTGAEAEMTITEILAGERMEPVFNLKLGTRAERLQLGSEGLTFLANGISVGDLHMQTALGRAGHDLARIAAHSGD